MIVQLTPIPDGSYECRVFDDGHDPSKDPIDTVCVLRRVGERVCEVSLAHGHLYNEANEQIGVLAFIEGFDILRFKTVKSVERVTRYATKIGEDDEFIYYEVNLVEKAAQLGVSRKRRIG